MISRKLVAFKGFTLFEIMVAVTILGAGIVMIYKGLLLSLGYQSDIINRLYAESLLDERLVDLQLARQRETDPFLKMDDTIEVVLNNKPVQFHLVTRTSEDSDSLARFQVLLSWVDGQKQRSISREIYATRF